MDIIIWEHLKFKSKSDEKARQSWVIFSFVYLLSISCPKLFCSNSITEIKIEYCDWKQAYCLENMWGCFTLMLIFSDPGRSLSGEAFSFVHVTASYFDLYI